MAGLVPWVLLMPLMGWGFFAHKKINRLAVFTLPPPMLGFYKKNIQYITDASVNPDRRRFVVENEAPRHYIDIDHYGDSAVFTMNRYWSQATELFTEDTLQSYGVLPWHVNFTYYQLRDAFFNKDPDRILRLSADIGHYIADAHVPLHTTENYDGQRTGQQGIHAFWESRLPELYAEEYDFLVGRATYVESPQLKIWDAIIGAHLALDSVLTFEKALAARFGERKYAFETKGTQTQKVYSREYSQAYHQQLHGMVERQMRSAVKLIGDFWYSAWVDAGQPDLQELLEYKPSKKELIQRRLKVNEWKQKQREQLHYQTE